MENIIFLLLASIFVGLALGRQSQKPTPETFKPMWFEKFLNEVRR
ncbi:MAG: hypothetical protein WC095_00200 [Candidatus Paceibacterota bacterium]